MLNPRWHKVLRDLGKNKLRTVLVVLSIAVGVFSVAMVMGTQEIMARELQRGYMAINPLEASLSCDPFEPELLDTIRRMPGVKEAEGSTGLTLRIQIGPDEWTTLAVSAVDDFEKMQVNKIFPEAGAWPPPKRELLIERNSLSLYKANIGDTVLVEGPDGKRQPMRIAGTVHDINLPPVFAVGYGFGYVSMDTIEWLGLGRSFNSVQITVAEDAMNQEHVRDVAKQVEAKIEKSGRQVYSIYVPKPGQHPAVESLDPIMLVLGVMGFLALILSGFLVVNTVSAILAQQTRQIGMMKAVGGSNGQVVGLYLVTVLVFGVLSLAVAVPLGALAARVFASYMASLVNFDMTSASIPPKVLAIEFAIGLIAPLLAALYPVLSGTRITVREAMTSYGLAPAKGKRRRLLQLLGSGIGQRLAGLKVSFRNRLSATFSRPLLLSLRNTFRRRGRLALTLVTLTLAGALFIGIFSVRASMTRTLDEALEYWAYDLELQLNRPYRAEEIEEQALQVPGVSRVESWGSGSATRKKADGTQSDTLFVIAPPAATDLIRPVVLAGRWLQPGDENALVVNTEVIKVEPDIRVGHDIILKIDDREETWHVVGIVKGLMTGRIVYANYPYYARVARSVGRAYTAEVVTAKHDAASQSAVAKDLERRFRDSGLRVRHWETTSQIRTRIEMLFAIMLTFLAVMVILLALVGGLGLMGTMSINVMERTREIGVLRAIGAGNVSLAGLVLTEGVVIGLLSWAAGVALAYPLSQLLSEAVGIAMIQAPLSYVFSPAGPLAWLAVVIVLAAVASLLPARNAAAVSVREALAYE